jgi:hypothetical protein
VSRQVTAKLNQLSLAELAELEAKLGGEQRMIDITPDVQTNGSARPPGQVF